MSLNYRTNRLTVLALLPLFLLVVSLSAKAQTPNPQRGHRLFDQICAKCHGADGSKTTSVGKAVKARDLRSPEVQDLSDSEIYNQVADGTTNMPPFSPRYRKDQIDSLVLYVRELGKSYPGVSKQN